MSTKIQISQVEGLENIALDYTGVSGIINTTGSALSGNLIATGASLSSTISTLSGNLISTGTSLTDDISTLSGNLISSGINLSGYIGNVSSDLTQTGIDNRNNIDAVSGYVDTELASTGSTLFTQDSQISGTLRTDLTTAESNITTAQSDITTLSGAYSSISASLSSTSAQVSTNTGDIASQQVQINTITGDIGSIGSDITGLEGDVVSLNTNLFSTGSGLAAEISTLSGIVDTDRVNIEGDVDTVSGNLDTVSGDLVTVSGEITGFQGDLNTVSGDLDTAETTISNLQTVVGQNAKNSSTLNRSHNSSYVGLQNEVAIEGGQSSYVSVVQWIGTGTPSTTGELFLGGVSGERFSIQNDTVSHVRLYGTMEDITWEGAGEYANLGVINSFIKNSGFLIYHEGASAHYEKALPYYGIQTGTTTGGDELDYVVGISGGNLVVSGIATSAMTGKWHIVGYIHETPNYY